MLKLIIPLLIIAALVWWANAVSFPDSSFAGLVKKAGFPAEPPKSASGPAESLSPAPAVTPGPSDEVPLPSPSQPTPEDAPAQPDGSQLLPSQQFVYQTFNNCGPASLSMLLEFYGIASSQQQIADELRPFQHPRGIGDDKAVSLDEIAGYARKYNLVAYKRPNGDIQKLRLFVENGMPVLTLAWIPEKGGFGHYRIVKGYDDQKNVIIEDDSIYGLSRNISYAVFLTGWQVFNYEYLVIAPAEKEAVIKSILADELDETAGYRNALTKAQNEYAQNPSNPYPLFNQSTSLYYLGDYAESVRLYESVSSSLNSRLLWYQPEPVYALRKLKRDEELLALTDRIFGQGNIAASELYYLRGEAYKEHGQNDSARREFEKAVYYNKNFAPAKEALNSL